MGVRTFLRFVILGTTGRAVLSPPTPQREYDLSTLVLSTSDLLSSSSSSSTPPSTISPNPKPTGSDIDAIINPQPVLSQLTDAAPLRSHLYPMTGALPDSHLPHPLSLLPELNSTSEWTAEIIAASTTLIHVLLLYRQSVRNPLHKHQYNCQVQLTIAAQITHHGIKIHLPPIPLDRIPTILDTLIPPPLSQTSPPIRFQLQQPVNPPVSKSSTSRSTISYSILPNRTYVGWIYQT